MQSRRAVSILAVLPLRSKGTRPGSHWAAGAPPFPPTHTIATRRLPGRGKTGRPTSSVTTSFPVTCQHVGNSPAPLSTPHGSVWRSALLPPEAIARRE